MGDGEPAVKPTSTEVGFVFLAKGTEWGISNEYWNAVSLGAGLQQQTGVERCRAACN